MKTFSPLLLISSLLLFLVAACKPKVPTPDPQTQIQQAIIATLSSIPTNTAVPIPTSYPTPTPFSLAGLFCEYQFCIGHPIDMAFFDVSAQQNTASPSAYAQGILAAFNGSIFIQMMWQLTPGASDPKFMLDLIVDDAVDAMTGQVDVKLVHNMNLMYSPITSTATPLLPNGGAGAWICGDRVFAWKVYTANAADATPLFDDALARFTCGQN
jgi:hypothetical protein